MPFGTNPTSYLGATLTWRGRELESYAKGNIQISYSYDVDGMRYRKVVKENDSVKATYDYVYSDGTLILITFTDSTGSTTARFIYDSYGEPRGFILNNTAAYLYLKNAQGDITGIVNENGEVILTCSYDAWGRVIFGSTNMAYMTLAAKLSQINPFTYRGYCYDYDIGMYYLQSRYYDPEICRFINADSTDYLGATGTLLSYNLFAYCENDGVNFVDETGTWGADIHYGKKYKNEKIVNSKGVFKSYNGTYEWLKDLNIKSKYRVIIAKACKAVDTNPKTNPIMPYGWNYHFSASSVDDYRITIACERLEKAINLFKNATKEKQREKALKELGIGLHALQDYSAHGYFWPIEEVRTVGSVSYIIKSHSYEYDDPYFDWKNSSRNSFLEKRSSLGQRYQETYENTVFYIACFLIGVGKKRTLLMI